MKERISIHTLNPAIEALESFQRESLASVNKALELFTEEAADLSPDILQRIHQTVVPDVLTWSRYALSQLRRIKSKLGKREYERARDQVTAIVTRVKEEKTLALKAAGERLQALIEKKQDLSELDERSAARARMQKLQLSSVQNDVPLRKMFSREAFEYFYPKLNPSQKEVIGELVGAGTMNAVIERHLYTLACCHLVLNQLQGFGSKIRQIEVWDEPAVGSYLDRVERMKAITAAGLNALNQPAAKSVASKVKFFAESALRRDCAAKFHYIQQRILQAEQDAVNGIGHFMVMKPQPFDLIENKYRVEVIARIRRFLRRFYSDAESSYIQQTNMKSFVRQRIWLPDRATIVLSGVVQGQFQLVTCLQAQSLQSFMEMGMAFADTPIEEAALQTLGEVLSGQESALVLDEAVLASRLAPLMQAGEWENCLNKIIHSYLLPQCAGLQTVIYDFIARVRPMLARQWRERRVEQARLAHESIKAYLTGHAWLRAKELDTRLYQYIDIIRDASHVALDYYRSLISYAELALREVTIEADDILGQFISRVGDEELIAIYGERLLNRMLRRCAVDDIIRHPYLNDNSWSHRLRERIMATVGDYDQDWHGRQRKLLMHFGDTAVVMRHDTAHVCRLLKENAQHEDAMVMALDGQSHSVVLRFGRTNLEQVIIPAITERLRTLPTLPVLRLIEKLIPPEMTACLPVGALLKQIAEVGVKVKAEAQAEALMASFHAALSRWQDNVAMKILRDSCHDYHLHQGVSTGLLFLTAERLIEAASEYLLEGMRLKMEEGDVTGMHRLHHIAAMLEGFPIRDQLKEILDHYHTAYLGLKRVQLALPNLDKLCVDMNILGAMAYVSKQTRRQLGEALEQAASMRPNHDPMKMSLSIIATVIRHRGICTDANRVLWVEQLHTFQWIVTCWEAVTKGCLLPVAPYQLLELVNQLKESVYFQSDYHAYWRDVFRAYSQHSRAVYFESLIAIVYNGQYITIKRGNLDEGLYTERVTMPMSHVQERLSVLSGKLHQSLLDYQHRASRIEEPRLAHSGSSLLSANG